MVIFVYALSNTLVLVLVNLNKKFGFGALTVKSHKFQAVLQVLIKYSELNSPCRN